MSELTLLILRVGFLLVLWVFVFGIVYALRSDLFGSPARRMRSEPGGQAAAQPAGAPIPAPSPAASAAPPAPVPPVDIPPVPLALPGIATQLIITSGVAAGTMIPLDDEVLTIGRSSDSTLVIIDEYTSTYHAELARHGEDWILTDLDSTNGTRLAGERVRKPVVVPLYTPVKIGTTTFELRPSA